MLGMITARYERYVTIYSDLSLSSALVPSLIPRISDPFSTMTTCWQLPRFSESTVSLQLRIAYASGSFLTLHFASQKTAEKREKNTSHCATIDNQVPSRLYLIST